MVSVYTADGFSVNVGAYVPPELKRDLQEVARRNRGTVSGEIRRALEAHVQAAQAASR